MFWLTIPEMLDRQAAALRELRGREAVRAQDDAMRRIVAGYHRLALALLARPCEERWYVRRGRRSRRALYRAILNTKNPTPKRKAIQTV